MSWSARPVRVELESPVRPLVECALERGAGDEADVDTALASQASSAIGFVTRPALQRALDQRSNGRLQLDPDGTG